MRYLWLLLCIPWFLVSQVTLQKSDEIWQLQVDGEPFDIKGVTFGYDDDPANFMVYFKDLKSIGVNTIRTWGTGPNTSLLLEAAERHNIKVLLGIWMRHGRPGMEADDSFDYLKDIDGMEVMYNTAIDVVRRFKGHPAVLAWGIGNEVYLNTETDEEKIAYSKFLERVCKDIKSMDKMHPILSVEAWTFGLDWWEQYVPSLDIYGLNVYGAGADLLQEELDKRQIDKPYVITEFGVRGEWDIKTKEYGVTKEPSDAEKYNVIVEGYNNWVVPKPSCLGVYVFHYGDGNHFAAPWLLTHVKGFKRPFFNGGKFCGESFDLLFTKLRFIHTNPVVNICLLTLGVMGFEGAAHQSPVDYVVSWLLHLTFTIFIIKGPDIALCIKDII